MDLVYIQLVNSSSLTNQSLQHKHPDSKMMMNDQVKTRILEIAVALSSALHTLVMAH